MTCNRDPVGDHGAHRSHTKCNPFSARAKQFCNKSLAHVADQVEVHIQQLQDCIYLCFSDTAADTRRSIEHMAFRKRDALKTWEDFLLNDRAHTSPARFLPRRIVGPSLAHDQKGPRGLELPGRLLPTLRANLSLREWQLLGAIRYGRPPDTHRAPSPRFNPGRYA
jgi:hypothetical protein